MKRFLLIGSAALIFITGCKKSEAPIENPMDTEEEEVIGSGGLRECGAYEVLQLKLQEDPGLAGRMNQIEAFTQEYLRNPEAFKLVGDVLEVPVHVNVLYKTTAENVSNAQIQSQIDVLNQDFGASNSDYGSTPSTFQGVRSGDIKIRFVWSTSSVTRRSAKKKSWNLNDDMKKSSRGGINPTNPATTLNIWVCNLSQGYLGYAQFPGGSLSTDGVVIDNNAFGKGNFPLYTQFNLGRTATHEVGHYFNLRHIWGDQTCGNDLVGDTPVHNAANGGCPTYPHLSTCSGNPIEMTMNYMDYTNDACMYMFTLGQASRMHASYAVGGPRASLR
jgi:hypothetical protein